MLTWAQHHADHERLQATRAAWVAAGRPQVGRWYGRGTAARRAALRTYGLRLNAHLQVGHGYRPAIGSTFDERHDAHERLHGGAR